MNSTCIKAKNGDILMMKQEILDRWTEYIEELFDDERGELPKISKDTEGPKILQDEVENAIKKLKKNKACGPDGMLIEMIQKIEEFSVKKSRHRQ